MAAPSHSRRDDVRDLAEEIAEDSTALAEKAEQLLNLLGEGDNSYSSNDFDDE